MTGSWGSAMPNQVRRNLFDDMKATWRPRQKTRYLCFNLRRADAEPVGGIGPDAGPHRSHSGRESGEINFAQSFHAIWVQIFWIISIGEWLGRPVTGAFFKGKRIVGRKACQMDFDCAGSLG